MYAREKSMGVMRGLVILDGTASNRLIQTIGGHLTQFLDKEIYPEDEQAEKMLTEIHEYFGDAGYRESIEPLDELELSRVLETMFSLFMYIQGK